MRFEKFIPQNFESAPRGPLLEGIDVGKRFVPPSLIDPLPPTAPPPPTITEADVKQAEQAGYRKGFLEGEKEGRAQAEALQSKAEEALTQAVNTLGTELHALIAMHNNFTELRRSEMPKLALAIARKVAGNALQENAAALVESVCIACAERLLPLPHIVISVAEALVEPLEAKLTFYFAQNHDPGIITIQADPAMQPGDCRIAWEQGAAERNTAQLWQEVERIIEEMTSAPAAPHPQFPPLSEPGV